MIADTSPLAPQELLLQWVLEAFAQDTACTRAKLLARLVDRFSGTSSTFKLSAEALGTLLDACLAELARRDLIEIAGRKITLKTPRQPAAQSLAIDRFEGLSTDRFKQNFSVESMADLVPLPRAARRSRKKRRTGKLAENIPRSMRVHVPEEVEIRISRFDSVKLIAAMTGRGTVQTREVSTTEAMSLRLNAPNGGFVIDPHSFETQWVHSGHESEEEFAAWRFTITPTCRGLGLLRISLAYKQIGDRGIVADKSLPDETIDVRVNANMGRACIGASGWTLSMLVGAALGAYFSDIVRWLGLLIK